MSLLILAVPAPTPTLRPVPTATPVLAVSPTAVKTAPTARIAVQRPDHSVHLWMRTAMRHHWQKVSPADPASLVLAQSTPGGAIYLPVAGQVPGVVRVDAGGARFSPSGSTLARREPDNEQGWVAIADRLSGNSKLVATSPAQDYFAVVAWLDADTLVLQSGLQTPGVWIVRADVKNTVALFA